MRIYSKERGVIITSDNDLIEGLLAEGGRIVDNFADIANPPKPYIDSNIVEVHPLDTDPVEQSVMRSRRKKINGAD